MPPTAPPSPPRPTTDPTALRGNKSEASVYRFADQPWCAAVATPTSATASHMFVCARPTKITDVTATAQISMAAARARLVVHPRFTRAAEIQPPPIDPTADA